MAAVTELWGCDACDRKSECVRTVCTRHGDTDQCCRCRQVADADGFCDDCRPDDAPADVDGGRA